MSQGTAGQLFELSPGPLMEKAPGGDGRLYNLYYIIVNVAYCDNEKTGLSAGFLL